MQRRTGGQGLRWSYHALTFACVAALAGCGSDGDNADDGPPADELPATEEPSQSEQAEAEATTDETSQSQQGGQAEETDGDDGGCINYTATKQGAIHEVRACETLLRIADAECGERGAYLSIFEANRGLRMVGGKTFTDPNHIEVGWLLNIDCESTGAYEIEPPDDDEPPPTISPDIEDDRPELQILVGVGIADKQRNLLGNLLRLVPTPIVSTGPIPPPPVTTTELSRTDVSPSSSINPPEFGRRSVCGSPALGSSSLAATSLTYGEEANGVITLELPANGVFVLKLDASDAPPERVVIADDADRTIEVPRLPSASETANVYQLFLTDLDQPGGPPRLALGEYRYQAQFADTVAEGILRVLPPEERVEFHHVSSSLQRIMIWTEPAAESVELAAYRWEEENCEGAWIAYGLNQVQVSNHWVRVDVPSWGAEEYCIRVNGSTSSKCPLRVPQG